MAEARLKFSSYSSEISDNKSVGLDLQLVQTGVVSEGR